MHCSAPVNRLDEAHIGWRCTRLIRWLPMFFVCKPCNRANCPGTFPSMEPMARACATSSSQLRPCPRRNCKVRHVLRYPLCRRGRWALACSASAVDDADVVDLFDAAKLTVTSPSCSFLACCSAHVSRPYQVDRFVESGMVVGLGSGPASALAIQYLGTRLRRGSLTNIVGITS